MPSVIALAQQKGGVGKSTLAIHMAVEMTERGRRVAIVDLDPQGTAMKWRSRRVAEQPIVVSSEPARLSKTIADLADYQFVFLDLPGRRSPGVNEGLRLSDFVIVPARPLDIDIEASFETIAACQRMKRPYAFAMTSAPPGGRRAKQFTNMIREKGLPVIPAIVTELLAYPDAITEGLGVSEWEPDGKASAEISVFTTAVLKELRR